VDTSRGSQTPSATRPRRPEQSPSARRSPRGPAEFLVVGAGRAPKKPPEARNVPKVQVEISGTKSPRSLAADRGLLDCDQRRQRPSRFLRPTTHPTGEFRISDGCGVRAGTAGRRPGRRERASSSSCPGALSGVAPSEQSSRCASKPGVVRRLSAINPRTHDERRAALLRCYDRGGGRRPLLRRHRPAPPRPQRSASDAMALRPALYSPSRRQFPLQRP